MSANQFKVKFNFSAAQFQAQMKRVGEVAEQLDRRLLAMRLAMLPRRPMHRPLPLPINGSDYHQRRKNRRSRR